MSESVHSPLKAIRRYCLDCAGNSRKEVRFCKVPTCALYPFRMGHNPYHGSRGRHRNGPGFKQQVENVGGS